MTPEQMASPRVGGILGQGGTSIADIQDTLNAVSDGKLRRVGPYRVTRSMGSTVSAVLSTAFNHLDFNRPDPNPDPNPNPSPNH